MVRLSIQAGVHVKRARKMAGMRQVDLGVVLGRSQSWISQVEMGTANLTLRKLEEIVAAAGAELRLVMKVGK